ncbi:MAG: isochorismate synthase [candidate division Zixibacteria bacterium]|nr:isochorismate synthase [candidate division Zixibacteria bacterium]
MTTSTNQQSLSHAIEQLVERLHNLSNERDATTSRVRRIEIKIDLIDPLAWLNAQPDGYKTYWRSRDATFEMAGLGVIDIIAINDAPDFDHVQTHIAGNLSGTSPAVRYYGGLRFDPSLIADKRDSRWNSFGSCRLVLHRFELVIDNGRGYLACNLFEDEQTDKGLSGIIAATRILVSDFDSPTTDPIKPTKREDFPNRDRWIDNVKQAIASFDTGDSQKLVLARRASMQFASGLRPWALLERLRKQSENCFLFGVHPGPQTSFVGATPERLFRREANQIFTEAMAGTRRRGNDTQTDRELSNELTTSEKELWEHRLVVTGIEAGLGRICDRHTTFDGPLLFKLARIQHLQTRFTGHLKPTINEFQIISALHPSAAVGGYPVETAPALLHQFEPFDRGWYAGQVGWIGADSAEFAVAIRSALLSDTRLDLFSGAGIVRDSQPETEWDEIEAKIGQFLSLTNGPQS